jgi:hypothetical protein
MSDQHRDDSHSYAECRYLEHALDSSIVSKHFLRLREKVLRPKFAGASLLPRPLFKHGRLQLV